MTPHRRNKQLLLWVTNGSRARWHLRPVSGLLDCPDRKSVAWRRGSKKLRRGRRQRVPWSKPSPSCQRLPRSLKTAWWERRASRHTRR